MSETEKLRAAIKELLELKDVAISDEMVFTADMIDLAART